MKLLSRNLGDSEDEPLFGTTTDLTMPSINADSLMAFRNCWREHGKKSMKRRQTADAQNYYFHSTTRRALASFHLTNVTLASI